MSKGYENNPINGSEHVREQLSDYMDGLLTAGERAAVRAHMDGCVDCRADYIELRATQQALRSMPAVAAPRAFTLTPEMARQARKVSLLERIFSHGNAPKLATGSVVAFLVLFLVMANSNFTGPQSSAALMAQPSAKQAPTQGLSEAAPVSPNDRSSESPDASAAQAQSTSTSAAPSAGGSASGTSPEEPTIAAGAAGDSSANSQTTTSGLTDGTASPPNAEITNSENSSPTTTTMKVPSSEPDNPTTTYALTAPTSPNDNTSPTAASDSSTGWIALQVGLLALGLALAVGAYIAWRRV
ncbi:MAG: zf-HC2 domain-containing protein [Chloroflexota bacterium]